MSLPAFERVEGGTFQIGAWALECGFVGFGFGLGRGRRGFRRVDVIVVIGVGVEDGLVGAEVCGCGCGWVGLESLARIGHEGMRAQEEPGLGEA